MEKNISQVLKEATKDILTEEVLSEIEAAFEASVNEKVTLNVTKALNEQDEEYTGIEDIQEPSILPTSANKIKITSKILVMRFYVLAN